jgi:hypothetical protein
MQAVRGFGFVGKQSIQNWVNYNTPNAQKRSFSSDQSTTPFTYYKLIGYVGLRRQGNTFQAINMRTFEWQKLSKTNIPDLVHAISQDGGVISEKEALDFAAKIKKIEADSTQNTSLLK